MKENIETKLLKLTISSLELKNTTLKLELTVLKKRLKDKSESKKGKIK